MAEMATRPSQAAGLRRHIPDLAVDWALDMPEQRWQIIEGTLCFADISGFTALAERLAQRGRVGGEELVETLGRVFAAMLDIVHERRGELLKFGGDALLLFFSGDDHAVNAASAAVEMRQALRKAVEIPTSVGPLKLAMSVGLHTGAVHFFLVGSTHRELVLLGPAANTLVETENAANAGQILVSTATAEVLPTGATRPREDGELLLRWRKAPIPAPGCPPQREVPDELLRSLFPKELGDFLQRGVPEPEHRIACMAFAKFSGTDALLAERGVEALAEALQQTIGHAQACLAEEGVTLLAVDVDKDGGKLFMGAGVPFGHEDDEGVMLRALKRIAAHPLPLPLQMGVNRGHVFAAEVGAPLRAAYSAMGDTTNTAARIAGKTPAGSIWAHPEVLDECLTLYAVTPSQPMTMKGKKVPLVVYEVGEELGQRQREGVEVEFFYGREPELATLQAAIQSLGDGSGGVIVVEGESGLGKSRLLQEALSRAGVEPDLALRGEPYGANSPYRALRDPVRRLLGIERDEPAAMATALEQAVTAIDADLAPMLGLLSPVVQIPIQPSPEVQAIDPQYRPERTAALVMQLIEKAHPGPRVFLADDAHWVDDASAQLLSQIAAASTQQPWLVLAARRAAESGFDPAQADRITLGPLDDESLRSLVMVVTEAAPLRPHELDQVVQRAGGNPLFATEIIKTAREVGSLDAVPLSLEAAMSAQVDALDPDSRRVLRYASVLGRSFSRAVLEAIMATEGHHLTDATLALLAPFLDADGAERLRFRSGIVRDTTYEAVAYRLRSRLHRAAGETMERLAVDPASAAHSLALHFSRAGDDERAWRYATLAAERARDAYANTEAARLYELALSAARELDHIDDQTLIGAWRNLGEARELAGEFDRSLDAFSRALKLARNDAVTTADLLLHRATVKDRVRKPSSALADMTRALRALEGRDDDDARRMEARIHAFRAIVNQGQGRLERAIAAARIAEQEARAVGDQQTLGKALNAMGWATLMVQGPEDGRYFREALAAFEACGDLTMQATVESNLGVVCAMAGSWDEAVELFRDAAETSRRIGDAVGSAATAQNLGEMLVKQRRFDEAEPVLQDALRVLHAAGYAEGAGPEVHMAQVLMHREALAEADVMLTAVIDAFRRTAQPLLALEASAVLAECRLRVGQPKEALDLLDHAAQAAGKDADFVRPVTAAARARALTALARYEEAEEEISAGLAASIEGHLPYEEAMLRSARIDQEKHRGQVPDPEDLAAVRDIFTRLGVLDA